MKPVKLLFTLGGTHNSDVVQGIVTREGVVQVTRFPKGGGQARIAVVNTVEEARELGPRMMEDPTLGEPFKAPAVSDWPT